MRSLDASRAFLIELKKNRRHYDMCARLLSCLEEDFIASARDMLAKVYLSLSRT
jgi:hypothetical protein